MFTGLIRHMGKVISLTPFGSGSRLSMEVTKTPNTNSRLSPGDSVAVNGVCLTVVGTKGTEISMDISPETLNRTTLGTLKPGEAVNLEMALRLGDSLDGHIILGHVDEVISILEVKKEGEFYLFRFSLPPSSARYIARKGSVAVDGISLTVKDAEGEYFVVAVIPHTYKNTNLQFKKPGDKVNLELDVIARYVARLMGYEREDLSLDLLKRAGFA